MFSLIKEKILNDIFGSEQGFKDILKEETTEISKSVVKKLYEDLQKELIINENVFLSKPMRKVSGKPFEKNDSNEVLSSHDLSGKNLAKKISQKSKDLSSLNDNQKSQIETIYEKNYLFDSQFIELKNIETNESNPINPIKKISIPLKKK